MDPSTSAIRPILLVALLALPGCFSLSRDAPLQQHYVLGSEAPPGSTVSAGEAVSVVGLRSPRVAEYLATPFIVVRRGTHRIGFSEFNRWGEDLARGIGRTVAGHMAARSSSLRVETVPWPSEARPDPLIQLQILRFEGVAPDAPAASEGEAHLLATWEILRAGDGALLARGTTEVRTSGWTVGDFDGLVTLLDAGLGALAEELVLRLLELRSP